MYLVIYIYIYIYIAWCGSVDFLYKSATRRAEHPLFKADQVRKGSRPLAFTRYFITNIVWYILQ